MEKELSRREREIMEILYAQGESSASHVREKMDGDPADATVRTLLRILVQKGIVQQRSEGKRYMYRPKKSKRGAAKKALDGVLEVFFAGNVEQAMALYFEDPTTRIDDQQRKRLIAMIDKASQRKS